MHRTRQQDLPFQGSSHQFVGADHGDVGFNGQKFEAGPDPLVQVDVHLDSSFIQDNLA